MSFDSGSETLIYPLNTFDTLRMFETDCGRSIGRTVMMLGAAQAAQAQDADQCDAYALDQLCMLHSGQFCLIVEMHACVVCCQTLHEQLCISHATHSFW